MFAKKVSIPKVVRLKVLAILPKVILRYSFNSKSGSIKRFVQYVVTTFPKLFQFQKWFD